MDIHTKITTKYVMLLLYNFYDFNIKYEKNFLN